ncbi:MAG: hypothetical protein PVS3B1_24670 [Ktedonobacteraceae bacterium]
MVGELHFHFLSDVILCFFSTDSVSHPEENGFEAFFDPLIDEVNKCDCSADADYAAGMYA